MSNPKPKAVQSPYQGQQAQQQETTNRYGTVSIADSPEARALLDTNLDFGGGNYTGSAADDYSGDAYKDIKDNFKFSIDPGVRRRTDLREQEAENEWNSAFMGGVPREYRTLLRDSERRQIRSQGAAEEQQAEYAQQQAQQQADYQSSLARAQLRDSGEQTRARLRDESERTKAGMMDSAAAARTAAELERRRILLPNVVQTGGTSSGSGTSSGYNTQVVQPQGGFWSSFGSGLASSI